MAECVYVYKGQTYTPQRFAQLTQQGLIDSIDYVNLGKKISIADADKYIKSVFGDLPEGTYQFLSMHLMHKLAHPGETLLGLMDNGIMSFLETNDGTTTQQIVRHEAFHRIFNYYLNEGQRQDLAYAAMQINPDLVGKDVAIVEEYLAKMFEDYADNKPQTINDHIKNFFNSILEFFNVYANSKHKINSMFKAIDSGVFKNQKPTHGEYANIRRALNVDVREYGITDYTESIRVLESMFEKYTNMAMDPLMETEPYNKQEIFQAIEAELRENVNAHPLFKKMLERIDEGDKAGQYKYFTKLLDDAFNERFELDVYEDVDATTGESFQQDHIILNDQKNLETKISLSVKSFLSYIVPAKYRDANELQQAFVKGKEAHKRVPPRFAFITAAQIIDGIDFNQDMGNILQNIVDNTVEVAEGDSIRWFDERNYSSKEIADLKAQGYVPIQEWGRHPGSGNIYAIGVGKKLYNLTYMALNDPVFNNAKFIDDNTFYWSESFSDITNLQPSQLDLQSDVIKITRNKDESSADFTERVAAEIRQDIDFIDRSFKQRQAQNAFSELGTFFGSMYRKNLYIAKRNNEYGLVSYSYFPASTDGVRLGYKSLVREKLNDRYVVNGKVDSRFRIRKTDNHKVAQERLKEFFKNLDIPYEVYKDISPKHAISIVNKLASLADTVDLRLSKKAKEAQSVKDTQENTEADPADNVNRESLENQEDIETIPDPDGEDMQMTVQNVLNNEFNSLLNDISSAIRNSKPLRTSESVKASDGKRMYLLNNSSNAHDVLVNLRDRNISGRKRFLPGFLKTPFYEKFNRFLNKGKVLNIIDHDGTRLNDDYAKDYTKETWEDWNSRNFNTAFVDWISHKTLDKVDSKNYIQYFPSMDRSRIIGVETQMLTRESLEGEIKNVLLQMAERPDIKGLKNYKRNSVINFNVIQELAKTSDQARAFLSNPDSRNITDSMVRDILNMIDSQADAYAQSLIDRGFLFSKNLARVRQSLYKNNFIDNRDVPKSDLKLYDSAGDFVGRTPKSQGGEYRTTLADIKGVVRAYYRNHYINSYWLAQTMVGDTAFFKDTADYLKRLDKVFGPGERGVVNPNMGIPERSRIMVVDSVPKKVLGDLFKGVDGNPLPVYGEIFDPNDGQAFMLPERAEMLSKSHGEAANVKNVLKPLYYGLVPKKVPVQKNEDGTTVYQEVMVPLMLKFSSRVLTDDLVEAFPLLKNVRDNMRENGIMELVFDTVTKVGRPDDSSLISSEQLLNEQVTFSQDQLDSFAFYDIANRDYRLQLNPQAKIDSKTANPSQLTYFLNALSNENNFQRAQHIYGRLGQLIKHGGEKFFNKVNTKESLRQTLSELGFSRNDERSAELLKSGLSLDFPVLNNPVIMAFVAALNKSSTKITFPGSKLVLQSDYGVKADGRRLQYRTETINGQEYSYAEIAVHEKYKDIVSQGDYVWGDMFGFRIPSSELHSAVPMKIVTFFGGDESNTIITPKELVALHGSDFDVDSLFVLRRSNYAKGLESEIANTLYNTATRNTPVGFQVKKGKYVLDTEFESKLNEYAKSIDPNDVRHKKRVDKAIDSLREKYWMNDIVDSMLEFVSSRQNEQRMFAPINMSRFNQKNDVLADSRDTKVSQDILDRHESKPEDFKPLIEMFGYNMDTVTSEQIDGVLKAYSMFREQSKESLLSKKDLNAFRKFKDAKFKEGTVFRVFEDLGLDMDPQYDLSAVDGNLAAYEAIWQGNKIIGIMANAMKSLSYSLRANANPAVLEIVRPQYDQIKKINKKIKKLNNDINKAKQINEDYANLEQSIQDLQAEKTETIDKIVAELKDNHIPSEVIDRIKEFSDISDRVELNQTVNFNGKDFNALVEQVDGTQESIWGVLDSLLNAAIDNVKELILKGINLSTNTADAWSAMMGMGIDIVTATKFMRQPVVMAINSYDNANRGISDIETVLENRLVEKIDPTPDGESDARVEYIESLQNDISITDADMIKGINLWKKNPFLTGEVSVADLESQYKMLQQFKKLNTIGNDINRLSKVISDTLVLKTKPDDFARNEAEWNSIGEITYTGSQVYIDTNTDFSFDLTYLFENIPHLKEAFFIKERAKQRMKEHFFKYHDNVTELIDNLQVSIKLDYDGAVNKVKLKDEFLKFIASSAVRLPSEIPSFPLVLNGVRTGKVLHGPQAFIQHFANKISILKNHPEYSKNKFLSSLVVDTSDFDGRKRVKFSGMPNMEYVDILDMENAFRTLNTIDFKYKNGKWDIITRDYGMEFSDFQREFVTYSLLTNGLGFSKSNYNTILPPQLLKEASDRMDRMFEKYKNPEDLARVKELFELSLATNYHKLLPSPKNLPRYRLKEGVPKDKQDKTSEDFEIVESESHTTRVLETKNGFKDGVDQSTFYDLRLRSTYASDRSESLAASNKFIKFYKGDVPFVLVNQTSRPNPDNNKQFFVDYYYRRLNKNNDFITNYHITPTVVEEGYSINSAFPSEILSKNVPNREAQRFIFKQSGYNYAPGLKMRLYSFADYLHLNPRDVIIEDAIQHVKGEGDNKIIEYEVTVRDANKPYISRKDLARKATELTYSQEGSGQPIETSSEPVSFYKALDMLGDRISQAQHDTLLILSKYIGNEVKVSFENLGKKHSGLFQITPKGLMIQINNGLPNHNHYGSTLIHETMHAAVSHLLDAHSYNIHSLTKIQQEAISNIMGIYQTVKSELSLHPPTGKTYGLKSVGEFISEAFSSPEFQQILNNIVVEQKSLWQWLVDAILDLTMVDKLFNHLGIPLNRKSALEATIKNSLVLMDQESRTYNIDGFDRIFSTIGIYLITADKTPRAIVNKAVEIKDSDVLERIKNCI